eukprot:11893410-Ditylum_brightwellii.AAC.1
MPSPLILGNDAGNNNMINMLRGMLTYPTQTKRAVGKIYFFAADSLHVLVCTSYVLLLSLFTVVLNGSLMDHAVQHHYNTPIYLYVYIAPDY